MIGPTTGLTCHKFRFLHPKHRDEIIKHVENEVLAKNPRLKPDDCDTPQQAEAKKGQLLALTKKAMKHYLKLPSELEDSFERWWTLPEHPTEQEPIALRTKSGHWRSLNQILHLGEWGTSWPSWVKAIGLSIPCTARCERYFSRLQQLQGDPKKSNYPDASATKHADAAFNINFVEEALVRMNRKDIRDRVALTAQRMKRNRDEAQAKTAGQRGTVQVDEDLEIGTILPFQR